MKKKLIIVVWFCIPLIPSFFYVGSAGFPFDVYGASIVLGVYSFSLLAGQLYLITRPRWMQKILSVKEIIRLHSAVPVLVCMLALIHRFLKERSGFSLETPQAVLGLCAWFFLLVIIIIALLLLADTFISRNKAVKSIRNTLYSAFKLSYTKVRTVHNMTVLLTLILCVHAALSSLSRLSFNAAGLILLCAWVLFCFISYCIYRKRGRK